MNAVIKQTWRPASRQKEPLGRVLQIVLHLLSKISFGNDLQYQWHTFKAMCFGLIWFFSCFRAFGGIADALRSVANSDTWSLQGIYLHTAPLFSTEDQKALPRQPAFPAHDSEGTR